MVAFADISNNLDTDISNNLDDCSICFYPIITDKYVTDCSHTFHHTCIHEWSLHMPICHCPLCNFIINIPELNNEITTDEDTRIACITNATLVDDIDINSTLENNANYYQILTLHRFHQKIIFQLLLSREITHLWKVKTYKLCRDEHAL